MINSQTAWIVPSIPARNPEHNLATLHTSSKSVWVTRAATLQKMHYRTSPTLIGRTPGHLSKAISWLAIKARIHSQSTIPFARWRVNIATACNWTHHYNGDDMDTSCLHIVSHFIWNGRCIVGKFSVTCQGTVMIN